ncbi:hypothetical protein U128_01070 [Anaplasma marginale str. Gypsy Plains]|nr:hypothetical protein U128_01070 [Anaplasma marginale str. Gypsy Plains]
MNEYLEGGVRSHCSKVACAAIVAIKVSAMLTLLRLGEMLYHW